MATTGLRVPTLPDVLEARRAIAPHLPRTPLHSHAGLSELVGADVFVKHENHLPTGAFKVRGGVNLVAHLTAEERERGLITASTGNHGQSIAFGGRRFGVPVTVCVPHGANPAKLASIRAMGAAIVEHGHDFDDAREHCEHLAAAHGHRYVHSGNEPYLIAGVATYTLEMLEAEPELDAILVPIGGGSGAAGACLVAKTLRPSCDVIGVQGEAAPAAFHSWRTRSLQERTMATSAEGLATRVGFMIGHTRNLVEAAGASPLAAALRLRDRLAGKRIALVCSGGNITLDQLRALLDGLTDSTQAPG